MDQDNNAINAALATQATVNALVKFLREMAPDAIEKVKAHAEKEARALTPDKSRQQQDVVNKVGALLFAHED